MWEPENRHEIGKGAYWLQGNLVMPRNATSMPKEFASIDGWTNWEADRMPPGVREGIPQPSKFAQVQHRSSLFDNPRSNAFNWDQMSDFVTGPTAQRQGAYWWDVLANNQTLDCPKFAMRGTWNAAPTGFTALRFLTPASCRSPMTPL